MLFLLDIQPDAFFFPNSPTLNTHTIKIALDRFPTVEELSGISNKEKKLITGMMEISKEDYDLD
jgi:hypothetical protein